MDEYDLLIITTDELKPGYEPLKQAHDANGISTVIKTTSEIGSSNPDDLRDYIRDAYTNSGIEYVLVGGDHDVIPAKILWVFGLDEGTTPYETFMPSDLYYACLDGPYNYDDDDKWGEPTDGENGEDVDLFADVFVGRACVGNLSEVGLFVDKTLAYMNLDPLDAYLNEVCLAGERLGDYGIASWGGNYLDQLVDICDNDSYITVGIPSSKYFITKLYDRDCGYPPGWPKEEIIGIINNGTHIISHDGHSNYVYNMKLGIDDALTFTNEKYCFMYSNGCMAGGFDKGDCIAEYFTAKTPHGAFAAIMNARYGWFWSYSTDGDSQRFAREFYDAIYGENITVISKANQDSKEDNLYIINRSCIRWCYYQLNLFGDPALAFFTPENKNTPPEAPELTGPSQGKAGEPIEFTIVSTDPDDDQVYFYIDWGDGNTSGWIGPFDSDEAVLVDHTYSERGNYEIKAKAKDIRGGESDWTYLVIEVPRNRRLLTLNVFEFLKNHFPGLYAFLISIFPGVDV
jgi:hypothetical protein